MNTGDDVVDTVFNQPEFRDLRLRRDLVYCALLQQKITKNSGKHLELSEIKSAICAALDGADIDLSECVSAAGITAKLMAYLRAGKHEEGRN